MTACAPEATASDNRTAGHSPHTATFTIAADGAYAARLTTSADGGWFPERWTLDGPEPYAVPLPGPRPEQPGTQVLPLADGRVLAARPVGGAHTLALLYPTGPGTGELALGAVESERLTLLPPAPCGRRAYALTPGERSTGVWLVAGGGEAEPRLVADVPGRCAGGAAWLDRQGRLLALDRTDTGGTGRTKTVVVDLGRDGETSPLLQITDDSEDRLLLADPDSGLLLVHSDAPGEVRLGWGVLGSHRPVRFPDSLHPEGVVLTPFAVQPGQMLTPESCAVALHGQPTGGVAAAWLGVWRPAQKDVRRFRAPAGWLPGRGVWTRDAELRLPCATVHAPCGLARLRLRAAAPPEAGAGTEAGGAEAGSGAGAGTGAGTGTGAGQTVTGTGTGEHLDAELESGAPQDGSTTAAPGDADRPEEGETPGGRTETGAATAEVWGETAKSPREKADSRNGVRTGPRPWSPAVRRTGRQPAGEQPSPASGPGPAPAESRPGTETSAGVTAAPAPRREAAPAKAPDAAKVPDAAKPPLPVRRPQVPQVPAVPLGPEVPHLRGAGVRLTPRTSAPAPTPSGSAPGGTATPGGTVSPGGPATLSGLAGGLRGGTVIRTFGAPSRPKPAAEQPRPPVQAAPDPASPGPESFAASSAAEAPASAEPFSRQPTAPHGAGAGAAGAGADTPCPRPGPVPLQDAPLVSALHDAAVRARSA